MPSVPQTVFMLIMGIQVSQRAYKFLVFCLMHMQEEPLNKGAWTYVSPRILIAANEKRYHKGKYTFSQTSVLADPLSKPIRAM